jgi:sulfoxide reductase heme-binding subunit YedZ
MPSSTRVYNHITLCPISIGLITLFYTQIDEERERFLWSMSTAYVALILLGVSAIIGPIKLLINNKSLPISIYLRRDIGIWAGIIALLHVFFGLQGHVGGKFWYYFIAPPEAKYSFPLRIDAFGLTSYLGLGATLIIIMLLYLSRDKAIKKFGVRKWKKLQRFSYIAICMTLLHNLILLIIANRNLGFIAIFSAVSLLIIVFQYLGYKKVLQKNASKL